MILFTGGGALAAAYQRQYECHVVSFRNLSQFEMDEWIAKCDVLIHNAANLRPSTLDEAIEDNFGLTWKIMKTVERVKPGLSFIYLSSMSILKTQDSYLEPGFMSHYAFSKYLGEIYCLKQNLIQSRIVRFSTIFYGDAARDGLSKLIFDAVTRNEVELINQGEARRDFIPIEIGIRYLNKIATQTTRGKVFNVSSGVATSFHEATRHLKAVVPGLIERNKLMNDVSSIVSTFSVEALNEIGKIDFDLGDYIVEFAKKIGR